MALDAQVLAQAMEAELGRLWADHFEYDLPVAGASQRNIFFLAIARGLLSYLAGEAQSVSTITLDDPSNAVPDKTWNVDNLQWSVVDS